MGVLYEKLVSSIVELEKVSFLGDVDEENRLNRKIRDLFQSSELGGDAATLLQ